MKKASKLLVLFLFLSLLISCTAQKFDDPKQVGQAIDRIITYTDKAIANKDIKLARSLWSEISEYGIKAYEIGQDELGEKLAILASCYEGLVNYLETGKQEQLTKFQADFTEALKNLKEVVETKE